MQRTPSLWPCPPSRRLPDPGGGAHGHGLCRGSPRPPRAGGSVPPWFVPPPALEAAPFSQVSREPRSRIFSREVARPALFAARAGGWRSARTSASPKAARRAPRRKCESHRGAGGRCPEHRAGRWAAGWRGCGADGGGGPAAEGPVLSWRRRAWARRGRSGGGPSEREV